MAEKIQTSLIEQAVKGVKSKFTMSAKVALKAIEYCLYRKDGEKAKETLIQCLKKLPKRKHLKVIK